MYKVLWDDFEGIRHELPFDSEEDARLEADALKQKFDYVEIVKGDQK